MPDENSKKSNENPPSPPDGISDEFYSSEEAADEELEIEDEFSLDQLSAAYAQVLKEQNRDTDTGKDESESNDDNEEETDFVAQDLSEGQNVAAKAEEETTSGRRRVPQVEVDDDASCPISPRSILEAILFVGGPKEVKLNSRKIAAVMRDVSPKEITGLVKELNNDYEKEQRAYRIVTEKGAIRMELHPDMVPVQNHILGRNRATKLTQQAIDVLAIVAYNQPIGREQVDKIRSRTSGSILNQMVKRNLLQTTQSETSPKIKLYQTTDRFLDLFGLDAVEDLPQTHDVSDLEELAD